jgi:hypothetical protein
MPNPHGGRVHPYVLPLGANVKARLKTHRIGQVMGARQWPPVVGHRAETLLLAS